ncbi:uncharacterized protein K489DRAFT_222323 [Dissoconium aciculare CBS 342.82]|uniref:Uncharacterized protein n=1 Tax=Dissoconium aciculare CBS 342.82 TaxID=1314786 RepID=A0A6J3M620_9PEZI|nr:uncharacterized protein K489DRAFT_222323 [Dissoconium aciculare CBS 342.82]KAF1822979.1 hypothetical protein K489DRAFT_222323 [Dissoconium aciculare CBS 342.82]
MLLRHATRLLRSGFQTARLCDSLLTSHSAVSCKTQKLQGSCTGTAVKCGYYHESPPARSNTGGRAFDCAHPHCPRRNVSAAASILSNVKRQFLSLQCP